MNIPFEILSSKKIQRLVEDAIDSRINGFDKLDESEKNQLTAACLEALNSDVDIVLSRAAVNQLTKILSGDCNETESMADLIKTEARDQMRDYMDEMFDRSITDRRIEANIENGLRLHIDSINGEATWHY